MTVLRFFTQNLSLSPLYPFSMTNTFIARDLKHQIIILIKINSLFVFFLFVFFFFFFCCFVFIYLFYFFFFFDFAQQTYVVGTHLKRLGAALLMITTTYVCVQK